ncbi:hypothetical protein GGR53DRAFT_491775 [Hypoxylon sp. FL1150]|nr:hypothetical protein GGR53DRAFT_491775 [Hypoxylon sp. FL1150]
MRDIYNHTRSIVVFLGDGRFHLQPRRACSTKPREFTFFGDERDSQHVDSFLSNYLTRLLSPCHVCSAATRTLAYLSSSGQESIGKPIRGPLNDAAEQRVESYVCFSRGDYHLPKYSSPDDRDKVYALLGPLQSKLGISPNYYMSTSEVYTQVARNITQETGSLSILTGELGRKNRSDLPSWVPDWSAIIDDEEVQRSRIINRLYDPSKGFGITCWTSPKSFWESV